MTSAGPLFVPAGLLDQLPFDAGWIAPTILLIVLLVAGCIAVARVRRWRQEDPALSPEEQIASYEALVERGDMDRQEFERIKAQLEQKAAQPPPDAPP